MHAMVNAAGILSALVLAATPMWHAGAGQRFAEAQAPATAEGTTGHRVAPEWVISEWINGPESTLAELRGKVVVIEFFQLWCPGCNRFSIPLMKHWNDRFAESIRRGRLVLISIHTVFEGHDYQNAVRLKTFVKEKSIHHLVGIDAHQHGDHTPETMKRYQTRGTPEMAVIDRSGHIRFQRFGGFNPTPVEQLIRRLLNEPV